MTPRFKNKLFYYFQERHDLLLTDDEIEHLLHYTNKAQSDLIEAIQFRMLKYRMINVIAIIICLLAFNDQGLEIVLWVFVVYNFMYIFISRFTKYFNYAIFRKKQIENNKNANQTEPKRNTDKKSTDSKNVKNKFGSKVDGKSSQGNRTSVHPK